MIDQIFCKPKLTELTEWEINCTSKFEISELAKLLLFKKYLSRDIFTIMRSASIQKNSQTVLLCNIFNYKRLVNTVFR